MRRIPGEQELIPTVKSDLPERLNANGANLFFCRRNSQCHKLF
jgi:hypothetical protein